MKKIIRNW